MRDPIKTMYRAMFRRVAQEPAYTNVIISDEFKDYEKFKAFVKTQNYQGKELDNDIFAKGTRRVYSSETCCFVSRRINSMFRKRHRITANEYAEIARYASNECDLRIKNKLLELVDNYKKKEHA